MPNVIKSATTVSNGTLKKNNFLIGVDTSLEYGPTSQTNYWNGISPATGGYAVYQFKNSGGISVRNAPTDSELQTIAKQYGGTNIENQYQALSYFNDQSIYLATNIDYPNLVTSGLTLNLDAGFVPSYPRSGTTWYDLSGSLNDATLVGGPSYNSDSIFFDGVNDYANVGSDLLSNIYTISVWFTPIGMETTNAIWSEGNTGLKIRFSGTQIDYNYSSNGVLSGSTTFSSTSWYNVVVTSDGSNVTMYLNNSQLATASASAENPTGNFQIGTDLLNNFFSGSIGQIGIYNRVLSTTELSQNYNALQSRFTGNTPTFYYFGGRYTNADDYIEYGLTLLNNDTSPELYFDVKSGFNSDVLVTAVDSNGKILVGGLFTTFSGSSQNYLIRLNSDGSKDESFNIGTGFNGGVFEIKIDSDGKILVGGSFSSYSGVSASRIVRLNSDGSRDTSFAIGGANNGTVFSIAVDSDNKIYVAGSFSNYGGQAIYGILRLNSDGTRDTTFLVNSVFPTFTTIVKILIDSNRKILVGGTFTTPTNRLLRMNPDGTRDTSFSIGTGFNSVVQTLSIDSNGKILVGGNFTSYSGISQNYLIRLNSDGSKDISFNIGTGFNTVVQTLSIDSNGKILVGGQFTTFTGSSQNYLIRLNSDGSKDESFDVGIGMSNIVYSTQFVYGNKYLVGGRFKLYKGKIINGLSRYNSEFILSDNSFNIGTGFTAASSIYTTKINSKNKILVGGNFTSYSGISQNRLTQLNSDGSNDTSFNIGTGFSTTVWAIETDSNNKVLVGGDFTSYSGVSQNRFIRLNSDGTKDSTLEIGTGFSSSVYTILVDPNSKILVGGNFTSYSGISQNRLIRLNSDGSKDTSFDIGSGFNAQVKIIKLDSNNKILIGGDFTSYSGISQNRLIRLNSDGSKDTSFDIGSGFSSLINTIFFDSNNKILVGGSFTLFAIYFQNRLIRLNSDGSKDTSFDIGTGFDNDVQSIKIDVNGRILVGGLFTTYNGYAASYSVILNNDGSFYKSFGFNNYLFSIN